MDDTQIVRRSVTLSTLERLASPTVPTQGAKWKPVWPMGTWCAQERLAYVDAEHASFRLVPLSIILQPDLPMVLESL